MMLSVAGLRAGYSGSEVLQGVDFAMEANDCVALIGRNGMGKTTFIKALLGLIDIYGGEARFQGVDLRRLKTLSDRRPGHRPGAGRPPDFHPPERGGKPPCDRANRHLDGEVRL